MSQAQVGNLNVGLFINTAQFAAGLAKAQNSLEYFGKSLKSFATGAAAITVFNSAIGALRNVAELGDVAESIGVTAQQLQVYQKMAIASGSSSEILTKGLQSIAEQSTDTGSALGKLFEANGMTVKGQAVNDIIRQFMELVKNARSPAEELAIITSVLGDKVGRQLVESFRTGAIGVDEASKAMEASGNSLSQSQVEAAQRIETKYNEITNNISIAWSQMVVNMITQGETFWTWLSQSQEDAMSAMGAPEVRAQLDTLKAQLANYQADIAGGLSGRAKFEVEQEIKRLQTLISLYSQAEATSGAPKSTDGKGSLPGNMNPNTYKLNPATVIPQPDNKGSGVPKIAKPGTSEDIYGKGFNDKLKETQQSFSELWAEMADGIPTSNAVSDAFEGIANTIADSLSNALVGLINGTMSVKDAFTSMAQSLSQTLADIAQQLIKSSIMKVLSMLVSGGMGGGGSWIGGSYFGGAAGFRAAGGPVSAGRSYVVGEKGPELFTPRASGMITANNKLGGNGSAQMNVTVINNSASKVNTRQNSNGDLEVMVEDMIADKLIRGGNKIDAAMQRGFGLRRAGR